MLFEISDRAKDNNIKLVGKARDEKELIELLDNTLVDVIVLDMKIDGIDDAGSQILSRLDKKQKVIILSSNIDDAGLILKAIKNGAKGFLGKDIETNELIDKIVNVSNGEEDVFSKSVVSTIMHSKITQFKYDKLAKREIEVMKLFAAGYSRDKIADLLHITVKAVDSTKGRINTKTNLNKPVHYLMWILQNKKEWLPELYRLSSEKDT